jgi:hypothetical protein
LKNANAKYSQKGNFFRISQGFTADLITLLSALVQLVHNSKGGGEGISSISCADPSTFYNFQRPKFNLHSLSFTFKTFDNKLPNTKVFS